MYDYPVTESLSISFQRYPYPPHGFVTALEPSCGALPVLPTGSGQLALPCPDGQAFWIGLVSSPPGHRYRLRVLVSTASGDRVDALTGGPVLGKGPTGVEEFLEPPRHGIPGIFRGDGSWWAFTRNAGETTAPACHEIELRCRAAATAARIQQSTGLGRQHAEAGYPSSPAEPSPGKSTLSIEDGETFSVRVDVVEPEHFYVLGGRRLQPLDESSRYRGWRLP